MYEQSMQMPVSALAGDRRAAFLNRTYSHLLGAILAFTGIEVFLFKTGAAETIARSLLGVNWLLVLGGFMIISWIATPIAHRAQSTGMQYLAMAALVTAQAIIFVPLLYVANASAPGAIQSAALVTVLGFVGLTWVAFSSGKDFTFLGSILRWGGFVALLLIAGSVLFGFHLGTFFSVAMVAFAGGAVLHDTSNVLRHFPEDRHVGAAMSLFASIALMFWYILRLFMDRR